MIDNASLWNIFKKYFWIFFLVGFIVYFPIFSNSFVWDDWSFIIDNPQVHHFDLLMLLGPNRFNAGPFYRPIPAIYFAIVYFLSGQQAFFYHLLQLLLHIACAYLLFLFLKHFFRNGIAFFLSLIFLVHPINVESVAYIGSTQSELYFLPGIAALLLTLKHDLSRSRIIAITALLFMAVMTKETGFLYIGLVITYRYLFKLNALKQLAFSSIAIIIFYILMRFFIGGVDYQMRNDIPIAGLSLIERLLNIPAIVAYYLKTFVFPLNITVWHFWIIKSADIQNFFLPLFFIGVFFALLFYSAFILYKKASRHTVGYAEKNINKHERKKYVVQGEFEWQNARSFIFFLFWLIIGICLLLQIVPLDMTVADRWFYFPIVGLLGVIGVGLQLIEQANRFNRKLAVIAMVIIITVLSIRTITRTFDYKNNLTLFEHDIKERGENFMMMDLLSVELYKDRRPDEAYKYSKMSVSIHPTVNNLWGLGILNQSRKQYDQAISAYARVVEIYRSVPGYQSQVLPDRMTDDDLRLESSFQNLALDYMRTGRSSNAIDVINEGLRRYPSSSSLYLALAFAQIDMNNRQLATDAIVKSYELSPNKQKEYIINVLKNDLPMGSLMIR